MWFRKPPLPERIAVESKSDASQMHRFRFVLILPFLMRLICGSKFFQLDDARLVPNSPRDDLPRMFPIVRFDDRPAAVSPVVATPLEVMKIASRVDFLDNGVAVACIVR